jgi:hypothetical protein
MPKEDETGVRKNERLIASWSSRSISEAQMRKRPGGWSSHVDLLCAVANQIAIEAFCDQDEGL